MTVSSGAGNVRAPVRRQGSGTLILAIIAASLASLPVFLVGALAVFLREDLGFSAARLGAAVTVFFAVAATASLRAGHVVEWMGWSRGLALGAGSSAVAMLGVAVFASSWSGLLLWMAIGGAALAISQPATNLALARGVFPKRQGLAFGMKQAAVPTATLVAGLTVPLLGMSVGWRAAFMGGAATAAVFAMGMLFIRPDASPRSAKRGSPVPLPLRPLIFLSLAAALGTAAGNSAGTFYVDSAVANGIAAPQAGLGLAAGSAAAVLGRILCGWIVDKHPGRDLTFVAALLLIGVLGFLLLSAVHEGWVLALGTALAFGAGWGWPGVLVYAVVRRHPLAPAAATGVTLVGVFGGGTLGPSLFGGLAETVSYDAAWLSSAVAVALASLLVLKGRAVWAAERSGDDHGL